MIENSASQRAGRRLSVRLASTPEDIRAAQILRWHIFYGAMGATPEAGAGAQELDLDRFDPVCDHLLVEDHQSGQPVVVGTYRLLRRSVAEAHGGFYSAGEYDLEAMIASSDGELLELGRSCVAPAYRDAGTIQLLWRGIASYLQRHGIVRMFGCASFPGTDPDAHAAALAYLFHNHLAPAPLRARAVPHRFVEMARLPIGGYDPRVALRMLPPLIKGYLRVGASVGEGAVVDRQFNTVDVFMIMPVDLISARYLERFGAAA
jgi:putative hemolysin